MSANSPNPIMPLWRRVLTRLGFLEMPSDSERRQFTRYPCAFPVELRFTVDGRESVVHATARDISVGGMLIETADVPESVIRLHAKFEIPEDVLTEENITGKVNASAAVRYRDPQNKVVSLAFAESLRAASPRWFLGEQGILLITLFPIILLAPLAWFFDALTKYLAVWTMGYLVTFLFTPLVGYLARRAGMVDIPDARRPHSEPTPRGGGLALVLGFCAVGALVFHFPWEWSAGSLNASWFHNFLLGAGVLILVGLADDIRGLRPVVKLFGQTVAAAVMFATGNGVGRLLGFDLPLPLDFLATILWFVALTNAFNLIDGLDGLATGLALIASVGMMGAFFIRRMPSDALVMLGLASACMAFLRYNFHPATIFLGDTGSMFLGFTFASIALVTGSKGAFLASIGVPLLAVGIPVFDTILAIWRRSVRTISPLENSTSTRRGGLMQPDAEHLHHRLRSRGMSQYRIAVVLYVLNGLLVLVGLATMLFRDKALGVFLIAFVAGVYILMRHLAEVELWDTGRALIRGLTRPQQRVVAFLAYPIGDVLLLSAALGVAIVVMQLFQPVEKIWEVWIAAIPLWVAPAFLLFCVTRVYSRVWSLARSTDYLLLSISLSASAIISLGIATLLHPGSWQASVVLFFVYAGLAHLAVLGSRLVYRGLLDGLSLWSDTRFYRSGGVVRRVLLYGPVQYSLLYLREQTMAKYGSSVRRMVVGFVDDDTNLRFRRVGGYLVLGVGEDIPELARKYRVEELVIVGQLPDQTLSEVIALCASEKISLSEWHHEERVIDVKLAGARPDPTEV